MRADGLRLGGAGEPLPGPARTPARSLLPGRGGRPPRPAPPAPPAGQPAGGARRMDFDGRLLRRVGGFGRRARLLAAASGLPNVPLALGLAAGLLLAATPPHRCRPDPALLPPALRNASGPELRNASRPPGSSCLLYRYPPPGGALAPNGTGPCTRGWEYALPEAGLRSTVVTQVGRRGPREPGCQAVEGGRRHQWGAPRLLLLLD